MRNSFETFQFGCYLYILHQNGIDKVYNCVSKRFTLKLHTFDLDNIIYRILSDALTRGREYF